jgi:hypothetical protein
VLVRLDEVKDSLRSGRTCFGRSCCMIWIGSGESYWLFLTVSGDCENANDAGLITFPDCTELKSCVLILSCWTGGKEGSELCCD